eukprot:CAMPEP_0115754880 /NCGR_PEP_ID=MMETSP0272-20121206/97097_1 /TAXON_ID=71861 /ORGANISM="Scrippsiella trochoidea, Strain CCMP3099" /LENGTH=150 /DNA_ID=CAMNT_0003200299 /DNA_START=529 /DNA_END=983 /DNA_ORIENTATION=+
MTSGPPAAGTMKPNALSSNHDLTMPRSIAGAAPAFDPPPLPPPAAAPWTFFAIDLPLVASGAHDKPLTVGQVAPMHEDIVAAIIGFDEAHASLINPSFDNPIDMGPIIPDGAILATAYPPAPDPNELDIGGAVETFFATGLFFVASHCAS